MAFQDIIQSHFTPADQTQFNSLMAQLDALLAGRVRNLSEEENKKYGRVKNHYNLLVNKARDYYLSQPNLSSPDVDWVEFEADYFDRGFLENAAKRLEGVAKILLETKRLHDFDNYQNTLVDYHYSEYKDKSQLGLGYDSKVAELKQFFPSSGKKWAAKANTDKPKTTQPEPK